MKMFFKTDIAQFFRHLGPQAMDLRTKEILTSTGKICEFSTAFSFRTDTSKRQYLFLKVCETFSQNQHKFRLCRR